MGDMCKFENRPDIFWSGKRCEICNEDKFSNCPEDKCNSITKQNLAFHNGRCGICDLESNTEVLSCSESKCPKDTAFWSAEDQMCFPCNVEISMYCPKELCTFEGAIWDGHCIIGEPAEVIGKKGKKSRKSKKSRKPKKNRNANK